MWRSGATRSTIKWAYGLTDGWQRDELSEGRCGHRCCPHHLVARSAIGRHVLPGEYDLPNDCGQEGAFTPGRVITGALGIVIAIALVFVSSIRDVD